jgi:hypothetical protein
MILEVIYGFALEIERSGQDFFAYKIEFTKKTLKSAL